MILFNNHSIRGSQSVVTEKSMKEVKKILRESLKRLKRPFSDEWLSEFSLLMEFMTANTHTNQIISSIEKEKQEAYASLSANLKALFKDGKVCLQRIQKQIKNPDTRALFKPQIQTLLHAKVDRKKIADPFFKLETTCLDYIADFSHLLEDILQSDASKLVKNYASLGCNKNIDPTFSPFLKSCKHDIDILSGLRTKAIWSKWELLLQWSEWTKNGISPSNQAFKGNLSRMFRSLKISEAMQSCGSFLLGRLVNTQTVSIDSGICLKSIQLFLDQDDRYWIIIYFAGENGGKREFFIKKFQREAQSYKLLKLLLKAEPYSPIKFHKLTHILNELEIKNELKKVFFPHKKFAGAHVQLGVDGVPIEAAAIVTHLSSLQKDRKRHPPFDSRYYCKFMSTV